MLHFCLKLYCAKVENYVKVRFGPLTPVTCPARQACDGQRGCRCAGHKTNKHWLHSHVFQNAAAHAVDSDVLLVHHPLVTSRTDNATILGDVTKPGITLLYASSSLKKRHEKNENETHTRLLLMN